MADVEHEPIGTRKGFSFTRTPRAGVKVRVKVGSDGSAVAYGDGIPVYREVELTAAEWVDVVAAVSADGPHLDETSARALIDLHMGPPEGGGL